MNKESAIERLRKLCAKVGDRKWYVEHAATKDGRSKIDDGLAHGMHPIYGEVNEIEFAAACVNYVREHVLKHEVY